MCQCSKEIHINRYLALDKQKSESQIHIKNKAANSAYQYTANRYGRGQGETHMQPQKCGQNNPVKETRL